MTRLLAWLVSLFGRKTDLPAYDVDPLPGERARTKNTGVTAQQLAWRGVQDKVADRRQATQPQSESEFQRLLKR